MNNAFFEKTMKKCQKTKRYQTCENLTKKELFNIRIKLSYNKILFGKFIIHTNEKNTTLMKKPI